MSSNASNLYGTPIDNASKNWYYPGWSNTLSPMLKTTDKSLTAIDIYTYTDGYYANDGGGGFTTVVHKSIQIIPIGI